MIRRVMNPFVEHKLFPILLLIALAIVSSTHGGLSSRSALWPVHLRRKSYSAPSIVCMAIKTSKARVTDWRQLRVSFTDITDSSGHSAAVNDGASIWFRVDCHLFNLHQALPAEVALLSAILAITLNKDEVTAMARISRP